MSEQQDKEKAIEALGRAGYEPCGDVGRVYYRQGTGRVELNPIHRRFVLTGDLKDLPALLNPITPEWVADAIKAAQRPTDPVDSRPRQYASENEFIREVLKHLFPDSSSDTTEPQGEAR